MLIEELDVAIVDPLGNLLAHLMRRPALDHIQPRPPILRFGARRGTNKQIILELSLKVILLDMVG